MEEKLKAYQVCVAKVAQCEQALTAALNEMQAAEKALHDAVAASAAGVKQRVTESTASAIAPKA